jgi:hypothetical protein
MALMAGTAAAAVRLTGCGATRKAWAAHHVADPNPKLVRGCCYLPKQADGSDRYYAVSRDSHGRVFNYSMHFAPRVSAGTAHALLARTELPPDARLVRSKRSAEWLILQFRSAATKRVMGSGTVGAALYSSASGVYAGKVKEIIISEAMTTGMGC